MKKTILLVVCALLGVLTASAQQKLVLKVNGVEQPPIEVWRIDEMKFIPGDVTTLSDTPDTLDLGLSVRWADRNLGAASPKFPGRLIGWGDTTLTNYSKKLQYFPIANVSTSISGSQYDVAAKKWDNKWHMPSKAEMEELIAACNWIWVNENDSVGALGTLKTDATKTIFLPATGYRSGEEATAEVAKGYYWTGTIGQNTEKAKQLTFGETALPSALTEDSRYLGLAIRPVTGLLKVPLRIDNVTLSDPAQTTLTVTVSLSGDAETTDLLGIAFGTNASALTYADVSDTYHKVQQAATGNVTFNCTGLSLNTTYYIKAYIKTANGYEAFGEAPLQYTTLAKFPVADAVDLDLPSGIKWASWNMGSTSPLDVSNSSAAHAGDHYRFCWGDPTGDAGQSLDELLYRQECADNAVANIAGTKYDIATVQWGEGWQIPTLEQFTELINNCNMTYPADYTDGNGKTYRAYKLTSKVHSDRFIYLPEAGLIGENGQAMQVGNACYYWTAVTKGAGVAVPVLPMYGEVNTDANGYPITFKLAVRPIYVGDSPSQGSGTTPTTEPTTDPTTPSTTPAYTAAGDAAKNSGVVDLGLSVKWAKYNLGTTSSTSAGEFYPWGDNASDKVSTSYSLVGNAFYNSSNESGKELDVTSLELNGTNLPAKYDIATVKWGGKWRMPTRGEWDELLDTSKCTWTWNGSGYTVTSKVNGYAGNSIYLPAVGYKFTNSTGQTEILQDKVCNYWSKSIDDLWTQFMQRAMRFQGDGTDKGMYGAKRYYAMPVRPVLEK